MKTYEHRILVHNPHLQSLASLILLTREYLIATRPVRNYRLWLIYRRKLLTRWKREREELKCYYCGKGDLKIRSYSLEKIATLDHVIPKSKGGEEYSEKNLVVACHPCNKNKKNKMPV